MAYVVPNDKGDEYYNDYQSMYDQNDEDSKLLLQQPNMHYVEYDDHQMNNQVYGFSNGSVNEQYNEPYNGYRIKNKRNRKNNYSMIKLVLFLLVLIAILYFLIKATTNNQHMYQSQPKTIEFVFETNPIFKLRS